MNRNTSQVPSPCSSAVCGDTTEFLDISSCPFFVVFTTTPRSPVLAREVAGDATIAVSVSSEVSVVKESLSAKTETETVLSDRSSDSRSSRLTTKMFRRSRKTSLSSL
ncbi:hypothetical protein K438DRAFT_1829614 [Mycena galopus ATCC 62051]|nr:hypothetical protein K438DRAFT_1829614 [Mycena galopus ATCC 62051]